LAPDRMRLGAMEFARCAAVEARPAGCGACRPVAANSSFGGSDLCAGMERVLRLRSRRWARLPVAGSLKVAGAEAFGFAKTPRLVEWRCHFGRCLDVTAPRGSPGCCFRAGLRAAVAALKRPSTAAPGRSCSVVAEAARKPATAQTVLSTSWVAAADVFRRDFAAPCWAVAEAHFERHSPNSAGQLRGNSASDSRKRPDRCYCS
jgi:hypothetical protein